MVKKINWTKVILWVIGILLPIISIPTIFFVAQNTKNNDQTKKNTSRYLNLSSETMTKLNKFLLYIFSIKNSINVQDEKNLDLLKQKMENEIKDSINDLCKPIGFVDYVNIIFVNDIDFHTKTQKVKIEIGVDKSINVDYDENNPEFYFESKAHKFVSRNLYNIYFDDHKSLTNNSSFVKNMSNLKKSTSNLYKINSNIEKAINLINNKKFINHNQLIMQLKKKIASFINNDNIFDYLDGNQKINEDDIQIKENPLLNKSGFYSYDVSLNLSKVSSIPSDIESNSNFDKSSLTLKCGNFNSKVALLNFSVINDNLHSSLVVETQKIVTNLLQNSSHFDDKNAFCENAKSAIKIYTNDLINKALGSQQVNFVKDVIVETKKGIIYNQSTTDFTVSIILNENIMIDLNIPSTKNIMIYPTENTIKLFSVL